jgi:non-specific serine/threonine protein kinase/serine/threonine-protein kinase
MAPEPPPGNLKNDEACAVTSAQPSEPGAGLVIGPYHLLELIGEGGMGEVWLAEQRKPVRRRVALKLIKAGMDTREVVLRFESERQALALMDHPAIAKVFDAGSTPEGRPYFVMEYVAGIPITAYCDKHKLTTRQRMELFIQVCEGVQHAHQKAIIHRDLKPSNILVSDVDGKPVPRIIDFGLAKATSQRLTDGSMYTRVGSILGTLEYMSPEQADSGGEDIDTRTDVYSLGVVLYQLLVGALPLELNKLAYEEMLRRVRDKDVPKPSSRIQTQGGDSAITARNRGTDAPSLTRQLRGDPDAVVLKALEKDRKRRYGSPSELAADLGRYLRNEPVSAHAPSVAYRARKYIRRHRLGVALAAAAVLLLMGFAMTEAIQLRRITRERDRADRLAQFMTNMFKVSDPFEAHGKTVTAKEILDKSAKEIDTSLSNDPELQARMMVTMGESYRGLGIFPEAQSLFERSLAIQQRVLGPENPETLSTRFNLALDLRYQGRVAEAEKMNWETLEIERRVLGPEHWSTLQTKSELANELMRDNRFAEAEKLIRETIDADTRVHGLDNMDTLLAMTNLARVLLSEGRYEEAEKEIRQTIDIQRRVYGPEQHNTLESMDILKGILAYEGRYADAEKLARETLDGQRRVVGADNWITIETATDLTNILVKEGKNADAEKLARDTLDLLRRARGDTDPSTGSALLTLTYVLQNEGRQADAEKLLREALETDRRVLGPEDPVTVAAMDNLATGLMGEGHYADAEKSFREELDISRRVHGSEGQDTAVVTYNLACSIARQNRRDEAITLLQQAVEHGLPSAGVSGMDKDPDLKSLHADPRFKVLVARSSQTVATTK